LLRMEFIFPWMCLITQVIYYQYTPIIFPYQCAFFSAFNRTTLARMTSLYSKGYTHNLGVLLSQSSPVSYAFTWLRSRFSGGLWPIALSSKQQRQ
jgi:hypothetical protein